MAVFILAYTISRTAILSPMDVMTISSLTDMFYVPYKQMYADSLDDPSVAGERFLANAMVIAQDVVIFIFIYYMHIICDDDSCLEL